MSKWFGLIGAMLFSLVFATTVKTTIANPIGSNLAISGALVLFALYSFWLFVKPRKQKQESSGYVAVP